MAEPQTAPAAAPAAPSGDTGFPPNTPWKDMTAEQQVAYWQHQSRRHEDRAKAFGNLTPEQLQEMRDAQQQLADIKAANASDAERQATEARRAAAAEADAKYQPMLAETAFRVAIGDRKSGAEVDDFLGDLNLNRFLTSDGRVDTAKVLARVEQFAPATGTQQQPQLPRVGPSSTGQGQTAPVVTKPGDAGRLAAERRGFIQSNA